MKTPNTSPSRLVWVDLTRFLGAFLVVLAHVVTYPNLMGKGTFWAQTGYFTISRIAVPLFFMLSGMLLLSKEEPLGVFYRKRALKVIFPFLVWSLVYFYWYRASAENINSLSFFLQGIVKTLKGSRAAHLWFFYSLIGIYFITPVLRTYIAHASYNNLIYFCSLWLVVVAVLPIINRQFSILVDFDFPFSSGYIGSFVLGYFLAHIPPSKKLLYLAASIFFFSFLFTFFAVYWGSHSVKYDQFYEQYLSLNVILMSASAFLLLKSINESIPETWKKWLTPLSGVSFGVYLLHVLVLDIFAQHLPAVFPFLQTGLTLWVMPAVGLVGFIVCVVIILILQRIPFVKFVVP